MRSDRVRSSDGSETVKLPRVLRLLADRLPKYVPLALIARGSVLLLAPWDNFRTYFCVTRCGR